MTTNADAYQAGVDAVIADNTLNQNGFEDAVRTVATGISNAEADAWVTAIYTEYERIGIINNPTYGNLRNEIINEGAATARALFEALSVSINAFPESASVNADIRKIELRTERDEVDANITILQGLKTGQPRQVKDALNIGINELRGFKQRVIDELRNL